MQIGQPSRTALGAAAYRAVHQTLEGGVIFADPFAMQILDDDARAGRDGATAVECVVRREIGRGIRL